MSDVLVIGAGSLARSVCASLATICECTVTVLSSEERRAAEICYLAGVRASLAGVRSVFWPVNARYSAVQLAEVVDRVRPSIVFNTASHHSPWEATRSPSAWTALVGRAGFGSMLPLQAAIAVELGRVIADVRPDARYVNACFPDAVNPVLKALGLPVFCGIGNVALLAASLRASLGFEERGGLRVLGHHWHLHTPANASDDSLAWLDNRPVPDVTERLVPQRSTARAELNAINGHSAALLLYGLLHDQEMSANLPGPNGLPGGYPVRIRDGELTLDLPPTIDEAEAVDLNQRWSELDGVRISADGRLRFITDDPVLAPLASAAHVRELPDLVDWMIGLRSVMRREGRSPT